MRSSEVGYTWLRLIDNDDWPLGTLLCGKLQKDRQARQKESKKRSHGSPSERSYTFGVPPSIPFPSLFFLSLSLFYASLASVARHRITACLDPRMRFR